VDLARMWKELGVSEVGDGVAFDEGAALAGLRRAVTHSPPK
jgi:hypothetical protein